MKITVLVDELPKGGCKNCMFLHDTLVKTDKDNVMEMSTACYLTGQCDPKYCPLVPVNTIIDFKPEVETDG